MPRPDVHSALLLLLVTALSLPWQVLPAIAVVSALVGLGVLLSAETRAAAWRAVRRMRWLLASLLVLALFFTPGEPVIPQIAAFSPSWNGIMLMLERGMMLITLAIMATAFLVHYSAVEIVSAIRRLLAFIPGHAGERLALRIYLVLEEFPGMEERVRTARSGASAGEAGGKAGNRAGKDASFMDAAVALLGEIETPAMEPDTEKGAHEMHFPDENLPAASHWSLLLPLLLFGLFMFTAMSAS